MPSDTAEGISISFQNSVGAYRIAGPRLESLCLILQKYKKIMDRNHCAKCIHLKKNKEGKKTSGGITYYGIFPGMYVCYVGGRFWSSRPKFDFDLCEHFAKNKSEIKL